MKKTTESGTRFILNLRWMASITFFFLGLSKATIILQHGLLPYAKFLEFLGWSDSLKYYGALAALIEVYVAINLWIKKTYASGLWLMFILTFLGISLSLYSIVFRFSSDCGCGLLGENEYGLLAQKLIILTVLVVLFRKKEILFSKEK